jgi:hypothetical protein
LCRGAANAKGKEWGAIITWNIQEPPYLGSGPEILQEMKMAYESGAKYVIVFNYAEDEKTGRPIGILLDEHYEAMEEFWMYIHRYPAHHGRVEAQAAFVLPKDYGWGMRHPEDNIWGLWPADETAPIIWDKLNELLKNYGLRLDVVYEDAAVDYQSKYSSVYYWNSTL